MLELRDIKKSFDSPDGTVEALRGVSLSVDGGEMVSVEGPSGCGKSTLLLLAGGLLAPDSGQVLLEGSDPYTLSADERALVRARRIGFVFQQFHLIPYLSVLDNVLAASIATRGDGMHDRALELIRHFGLEHRARHVPAALSTGERQRVAMARALLNRPTLMLADEPTGNLDSDNSRAILDYLVDFRDQGGAVLVVTHDPLASGVADRRVRLEEGALL